MKRPSLIRRAINWIHQKTAPSVLTGNQWSGTAFTDSYKKFRNPTPNELLAELKGTAWTCASLNAAMCAANPPRLYVVNNKDDLPPKCQTRNIPTKQFRYIMDSPRFYAHTKGATSIKEVTAHPLLDLLRQVNPVHNAFDLWELTTLYQEVHGSTYWYLHIGPLGLPDEIWILPSQNVRPKRKANSPNIVDYYEYQAAISRHNFAANEIIHFRYPDPRDPYNSGLSPLRAAFEQTSLLSDYAAFKRAKLENRALPDAIVTPDEVIGEEERDRFEQEWNQKLRRGGNGKVVVGESKMHVTLLTQSMGDVAQLAEMGATKEDIANAFHVPLSLLTTNTNLANLLAAEQQHMSKAISPRLQRRDEKLNEQLIPYYDQSNRLFFASEDPVPANWEAEWHEKEMNLEYGVKSINEIRIAHGLDPVEWGHVPWLPLNLKPTNAHYADQLIRTDKDTKK